ncbi:hypothetical protein [Lewinella sp. 4G2]|uniref:hypothetical protein n=1 Tax=Lewinella sp. 4G2 TaxID=1803372 RepID=UPI0012F8A7F9|nr:hypothetical protein [Lewinella sp. 4G2]
MQKIFSLLLFTPLLFLTPSCAKKTVAVGDDGVDWAAKARQYRDDPASLRLFTEQCQENEMKLLAVQRELMELRNERSTTNQAVTNAQSQAAQVQQQRQALENEVAQLRQYTQTSQGELTQLRQQTQTLGVENAQLKQQLATMAASQRNDQVDTDEAVVQGVVFQVQLGAYVKNTLNPELATENALELQDQNGMQKVVVSQFRTYSNAAYLRDRLKQMGVKDAFVVAKNNGQRVTIPEALQMTGQN